MANAPRRKTRIKNRIRYCRMAVNISQKKAAFLVGVPAPQLSRWENGKAEPGIHNAIGVAMVTNRLVEDVFYDERREWREKIKERGKQLEKQKIL